MTFTLVILLYGRAFAFDLKNEVACVTARNSFYELGVRQGYCVNKNTGEVKQ